MKRTNTAVWHEKYQRWQINVQKDGERRCFYSGTPGRAGQREANKKADLWLDENIVSKKVKVSDAYEEYLQMVEETTSRSNYRPKESRYRNHIKPVIGSRSIETLSDGDLQNVINTAYTKHKLSKKSLDSLRGDLTAFFKFCRKNKYANYIPEEIVLPSAAAVSEKQILQPEELYVLLTSDKSTYRGQVVTDRYIYAYRLQVLAGLRPGEVIGLRLSDYDSGENVIYIKQAINTLQEKTRGKNKNARRAVYLTPMAKEVIEEQIKTYGKSELLFDISTENHYTDMLRRYCEYNSITVVTPYELRHTFVSIAKKLPEGFVKTVIGHSKSMDTFGVYGHAIKGEDAAITAALDDAFHSAIDRYKNKSVL